MDDETGDFFDLFQFPFAHSRTQPLWTKVGYTNGVNLTTMLSYTPNHETSEDDASYRLTMDVPGVKAKDLQVVVEDGEFLRIHGRRKVKDEQNGVSSFTHLEKSLRIGRDVDFDKMTANLSDGVLTVIAPKLETVVKTKEIPVVVNAPDNEKSEEIMEEVVNDNIDEVERKVDPSQNEIEANAELLPDKEEDKIRRLLIQKKSTPFL